ncbi:hypothetical protein FDA94_28890 [Herbidospora galbida]|uniref:Uncharacterized protein n=1 Tax=Herbidospora galbida TaxID=2575442 RepID=A0A4U3M8R3_9ACTN|nr:hypothetical protein [Herbidospora galbida]TKK84649.1 hypothetical protein FDA94_28890 [Herbidospora galbida]
METDYKPGDEPIPIGSVVEYFGSPSPGRYRVDDHADPAKHPFPQVFRETDMDKAYPDRTAYHLWPVGVPHKIGNRHRSVSWVRRTSFTVISRPTKSSSTS